MLDRVPSLTIDLYELTMAAAYFDNAIEQRGIFELFVRSLPPGRAYLLAAGLEQALDYLATLSFSSDQVDHLRAHPSFKHVSGDFFDYLTRFRFTGDVWAVPEGTAIFGLEPLLRVDAPIIEAQVIETFLLSTLNFQTLIASKAARIVTASQGRGVVEFGARRAHGSGAGLLAARAAFIGGCTGTSNVEAGYLFGIPTLGTLAHSFVMSFDEEDDAFRAFLRVFPDTATILVDTYDTLAAVRRLALEFGDCIPAVRLDSGDLIELSRTVRQILDDAGMERTRIFASGDLDEHRIAALLEGGARIDAFGVGTQLSTSADAPALGGVYKLVGLVGQGRTSMRIKLSPGKETYPGAKQVWRLSDERGRYVEDVIALADEPPPKARGSAKALLEQVMVAGKLVESQSGPEASASIDSPNQVRERRLARLTQARNTAREELRRLPAALLHPDSAPDYRVRISERLEAERDRLDRSLRV